MIKEVLPNGEIRWIDKSPEVYLTGLFGSLAAFVREAREILGEDKVKVNVTLGEQSDDTKG